MISDRTQDWIQIAGIFGVIISLIFVGAQLKQAQSIAVSDAYHARAELSIMLRMAPFQSPALLSGMSKRSQGKANELTVEESIALNRYINVQLIYIENVHYQYENGFIPEDQWQSNFSALKQILSDPAQKQRVLRARSAASATFYNQILLAAEELEPEQ